MKTKKIVTSIIAGFVLALFVNACSKSGVTQQPATGGNVKTINISGMAFPATTTVAKGTSITWKNGDSFAHTVTSDDGNTFSSGNLAAGASFTFVANTAGTFKYHCEYHVGMTGSLVVTP